MGNDSRPEGIYQIYRRSGVGGFWDIVSFWSDKVPSSMGEDSPWRGAGPPDGRPFPDQGGEAGRIKGQGALMERLPVVGISMGDPVGIGPEVVIKALAQRFLYDICRPLVLGDRQVLTATGRSLGRDLSFRGVSAPNAGHYEAGTIDVAELSDFLQDQLKPGCPSPATGRAMVRYITKGIDWAMEGRIQALVTCPINKMAMHTAGFDFEGHTELLAYRTGTSDYVMMLSGSRLKVALVTIHIPLAEVSEKLTVEGILKTIHVTDRALKDSFGILQPKLAVAGLNPHGGENGLFGEEESEIILPAVKKARQAGIDVSGPFPPDTLFHRALEGEWDVTIAMYHDQGLIPFKMVHFSDGVNTTLGLPIVRTSVDHGTAYDIAGKGQADPGSLVAAIEMAALQAKNRARSREA